MMRPGPNRNYYLKKREHGWSQTQAVIALARHDRPFTEQPPTLARAA